MISFSTRICAADFSGDIRFDGFDRGGHQLTSSQVAHGSQALWFRREPFACQQVVIGDNPLWMIFMVNNDQGMHMVLGEQGQPPDLRWHLDCRYAVPDASNHGHVFSYSTPNSLNFIHFPVPLHAVTDPGT